MKIKNPNVEIIQNKNGKLLATPEELLLTGCSDEIDKIGQEYLMWLFHNGEIEYLYKMNVWYAQVRPAILRRDNYECQLCKLNRRLTVVRQRGYVHHIAELKLFPRYALNYNNLVTLCYRCHEYTHDRIATLTDGELLNFDNFNAEERW